jgi:hypothetical protein
MCIPWRWLKMGWVFTLPLPTVCPKLCNKPPFSAFTRPLYLAFRGGWLGLAYGISGVWALGFNTLYLFISTETWKAAKHCSQCLCLPVLCSCLRLSYCYADTDVLDTNASVSKTFQPHFMYTDYSYQSKLLLPDCCILGTHTNMSISPSFPFPGH